MLGMFSVLACVNNLLFFWSVSVFLSIFTVFFFYLQGVSFLVLFNYYIFQEVCGLVFLISPHESVRGLALLLKVGSPPCHWWLFSLLGHVEGASLIWLLYWSKLPFLPLLAGLMSGLSIWFVLGLVVTYLQMFGASSFKTLLVFSALESLGWLLLSLDSSLWAYWQISLLYILAQGLWSQSLSGGSGDLLFGFFLMGLPVSLVFWVKYFALLVSSGWYVVLLVLFPLSFISLFYFCYSFIMLVHMGTTGATVYPLASLFGVFLLLM